MKTSIGTLIKKKILSLKIFEKVFLKKRSQNHGSYANTMQTEILLMDLLRTITL